MVCLLRSLSLRGPIVLILFCWFGIPLPLLIFFFFFKDTPPPEISPLSLPDALPIFLTPGDMRWAPAPPVLPAGAQVTVLDGDPFKPGYFSLRLKFPDGYQIPAHWHPTDEFITVEIGRAHV